MSGYSQQLSPRRRSLHLRAWFACLLGFKVHEAPMSTKRDSCSEASAEQWSMRGSPYESITSGCVPEPGLGQSEQGAKEAATCPAKASWEAAPCASGSHPEPGSELFFGIVRGEKHKWAAGTAKISNLTILEPINTLPRHRANAHWTGSLRSYAMQPAGLQLLYTPPVAVQLMRRPNTCS